MEEFFQDVMRAYRKKVLFTSHALDQMNLSDRMISRREVCQAIESDEVVEDYPDDPRGHSCLIVGETKEGRTIHVACPLKQEYLAIVTTYLPSLIEWEDNFRTRKKR